MQLFGLQMGLHRAGERKDPSVIDGQRRQDSRLAFRSPP
jgi:hypothetical protein